MEYTIRFINPKTKKPATIYTSSLHNDLKHYTGNKKNVKWIKNTKTSEKLKINLDEYYK